ncbi:DUF1592 domain-containing protein [Rhodopirellula bahusiensis]|uniref:DUF1592 domain-containing protein n=1 Tax=Rhodopirellula bahusiensis TaxID=2014065 RepID=UPI0032643C6D
MDPHESFPLITWKPLRLTVAITVVATMEIFTGGLFAAEVPAEMLASLKTHCIQCHGPDSAEANLRVDQLTGDLADRENALKWIEIRNAINLGEMPPDGEPPLPVDIISQTSQWVSNELREVDRSRTRSNNQVMLRRLNRHEYTHTVSDLLSMKFPTGESPLDTLPPDGTAEGFDKVGTALMIDPSLMTHYYQVARRIADRAIVDGPPEYPTETMRLEFEEIADSHAIGYLVSRRGMNPVPGGLQLIEGSTRSFGMLRYPGRKDNNVAPTNGFYRFTIRAGGAPGVDGEVPRIRLKHSHPDDSMQTIMEYDVTAPWDSPADTTVTIPRDTLGGELSIEILNDTKLSMGQRPGENFMRRINEVGGTGDFAESLRLAGRKVAEGWGGERSTPDPEKLDLTKFPRVFLDHLEVEGPLYDQWPPKSHTTVLFRGEAGTDDLAYAREILLRLLPIAWRRPIDEREVEPILGVIHSELENGETFHEAIRVGMAATLTSPNFLYLAEGNGNDADNSVLTNHEIASRMSYFLWSSMPDQELFRAAKDGELTDPKQRKRQVERMLADPKMDRFVDSFARQWLQTDTFLNFTPDRFLYREYDENLAIAIVREPLEFFREILRHDRSTMNFLDSDFVVINDRLAQHYGIDGVGGDEFRKVDLPPDSVRGGLLAMAGVHQAGSDGTRTKPVSRAVYVREVLFNNPPDPPPPNAGEVEPNIQGERLTVRERLLQHQEIEACAACHRSLDPYGLALENFNVVGQWREKQDGENFRGRNLPAIDASGRLPNGNEFAGFHGFRELLLQQDDRFRRALAEKLFIYAFGRSIAPEDDATLTQAVSDMRDGGDTFRALIQSIVTSQAFVSR